MSAMWEVRHVLLGVWIGVRPARERSEVRQQGCNFGLDAVVGEPKSANYGSQAKARRKLPRQFFTTREIADAERGERDGHGAKSKNPHSTVSNAATRDALHRNEPSVRNRCEETDQRNNLAVFHRSKSAAGFFATFQS